MKELSIEQKAKAYDEAISLIKDYNRDEEGFICVKPENIFPELKESKDEKIRNQIINFIEEYGNPIHCEWQKDWIAWLEKQGEQKPITIDIDKMVSKYSHTKDGDFGFPVNCQIRAYRQGINDALNLSLGIKKQGEQKLLNNDKYQTVSVEILDRLYESEKELEQLKQREQKPADWSEEDERMYNRIYDIVHSAAFSNYETDENGKECGEYAKIIGWLKSIKDKVQPKQEWGEEDEEMLRKCINATFGHGYLKECNWLKSLNPQSHWKPTKEQMNTMKYLAKYYAKGCDEPTRSIIEGLYEQLKQL